MSPICDTRRLVGEALGTFFLVLIGPGAAMVNVWSGGALGHVGVSLAFGGVVLGLVYALDHLSGAHLNPAVTVAFWTVRRFPIMAVATDNRVARGGAPIAVGLTVAFCALMGGPLTGASMNPARSLGPAVVADLWVNHWLYWVAPIFGMVAAAQVYEWLRRSQNAWDCRTLIGKSGGVTAPETSPAVA